MSALEKKDRISLGVSVLALVISFTSLYWTQFRTDNRLLVTLVRVERDGRDELVISAAFSNVGNKGVLLVDIETLFLRGGMSYDVYTRIRNGLSRNHRSIEYKDPWEVLWELKPPNESLPLLIEPGKTVAIKISGKLSGNRLIDIGEGEQLLGLSVSALRANGKMAVNINNPVVFRVDPIKSLGQATGQYRIGGWHYSHDSADVLSIWNR